MVVTNLIPQETFEHERVWLGLSSLIEDSEDVPIPSEKGVPAIAFYFVGGGGALIVIFAVIEQYFLLAGGFLVIVIIVLLVMTISGKKS